MNRTPEQVAADNRLDSAIREVAAAYRLAEGALVTTWVISAATSYFDAEGDECTGTVLLFPGGNLPTYIAVGLLETARVMLLHGERLPPAEGD